MNPVKKYCYDINGLRAIAVFAVIFHHFLPECLPGGFVGVDMFFVISGFLITGQLLNFLNNSKIKNIVIAANWPDNNQAEKHLKETLLTLRTLKIKVSLIYKNPTFLSSPRCSIQQAMRKGHSDFSVPKQKQPKYIIDILKNFPVVAGTDPNQFICDDSKCNPVIDNVLLYRDSGHLNNVGSRLLGEIFVSNHLQIESY